MVPLWMGRLSRIFYLNMRGNQLRGTFPHHLLQSPLRPTVLDMSHNSFSGAIPMNERFPTLLAMGLLYVFFFWEITAYNFISLEICQTAIATASQAPYHISISKLHNLESLDLSNNELSGNIPSVLADLDSLGYFNVSCNNLSGEIPSKGHLVTFDERSYIGNAHLCGRPTNISCNPTRAPEESDNEEEEHVK
ncbi:unnamed protein product [Microthlaspi erraticum]|uniref:Leucine-rich repeat-containing N-terminal plant-type domain-containing protein n=1 Tax=Microthlaspi erraticum TaxID=1685480 RepID=A0A6D2HJQ4_9BRAS|nr:unnamed protein product [Microthlaspi erraticum]